MKDIALTTLAAHWNLAVRDAELLDSSDSRRCFKVETERGPVFCKVQVSEGKPDGIVLTGLEAQEFVVKHGVPASRPVRSDADKVYHIEHGYCVTVEEWLDPEELVLGTGTWEELGVLCAELHSIPIISGERMPISRLDPSESLNALREQVSHCRSRVPVHFRERLDEFIARAARLDEMPGLRRVLLHSDITWKNVLRTGGRLAFVDFEGAGIGPAVMDLVEVTTKLCQGPSGSGPLMEDSARAFYGGYVSLRPLSKDETTVFEDAHFFHQFYYLSDSLIRQDFDFINRMDARLKNWGEGVLKTLLHLATE
jgi:Ser/Thr protein kinase RdoA (MazF antagonist)